MATTNAPWQHGIGTMNRIGSATVFDLPLPPMTADGDSVLVFLACSGPSAPDTGPGPDSWSTPIASQNQSGHSTNVYRRVWHTGDSRYFTASWNTSQNSISGTAIAVFNDYAVDSALSQGNSASTTATAPGITPTYDNELLVWNFAVNGTHTFGRDTNLSCSGAGCTVPVAEEDGSLSQIVITQTLGADTAGNPVSELTDTIDASVASTGMSILIRPAASGVTLPVTPKPKHVIADLMDQDTTTLSDILTNPDVLDVISVLTARFSWSAIEGTTEGTYNWTTLDTQLHAAHANGKKVIILWMVGSPGPGGAWAPSWAKSGIETFTDVNGKVYPVPWDPTFIDEKMQVFTDMETHLHPGNHPGYTYDESDVGWVAWQCANGTSNDWGLPDTSDDVTAWGELAGPDGPYTSAKLINSCTEQLDDLIGIFPDYIKLYLPIGRNTNGLDPTEIYAALRVADYGRINYPTRAVFGKNTITDGLPDITAGPISPAQDIYSTWQAFYPPIAGQMSAPVGDDPSEMADILNRFGPYDGDFLQIYDADLEISDLTSTFHDWVASGGP